MIVYYENSNGEKVNLLKAPYRTTKADWFDSDWSESSEGYEKTVMIDVFGARSEFQDNMEQLYRVLAYDSENGTYGRLYVNGAYLRCNVLKTEKTNWKGYVYSEIEITFSAPELVWIVELEKEFFRSSSAGDTSGKEYKYDYPYEYTEDIAGNEEWNVDHITDSDFQMIIYGPCVNPKVTINDYPYEVTITLESGEYLIIDSQENLVVKCKANGEQENAFEERGLEKSVFEKIPAGLLKLVWSGEFGFDLTLFLNRREPLW